MYKVYFNTKNFKTQVKTWTEKSAQLLFVDMWTQ